MLALAHLGSSLQEILRALLLRLADNGLIGFRSDASVSVISVKAL